MNLKPLDRAMMYTHQMNNVGSAAEPRAVIASLILWKGMPALLSADCIFIMNIAGQQLHPVKGLSCPNSYNSHAGAT